MTGIGSRVKVAVTAVAVERDREQVPVPEHPPPLQPEKVEPGSGLAERVTLLPKGKLLEHVGPQSIPAGALVTVPLPVPILLTVRLTGCKANMAVTVVAADRETMHGPVPEQPPPLHPKKVEPVVATAESVTLLALGKLPVQVEPQLIPAGELVTVPVPTPAMLMVSATVCTVKLAVTVVVALRVTEQLPEPEQPPPFHPVNVEPGAGLAERVTDPPLGKLLEQVGPQLIPAGALVTVPVPVPALLMVRGIN
jgi:hypothetical protein